MTMPKFPQADCGITATGLAAAQPNTAAMLAEMAVDPVAKKNMQAMQAEIQALLDTAIDALTADLAQDQPRLSALSASGAVGGAALSRVSRRAGMDAHDRRDFARRVLIAALLNRHNPDWNPADASTDRADYDDPIIVLMQMDLRPAGS